MSEALEVAADAPPGYVRPVTYADHTYNLYVKSYPGACLRSSTLAVPRERGTSERDLLRHVKAALISYVHEHATRDVSRAALHRSTAVTVVSCQHGRLPTATQPHIHIRRRIAL